MFEHAVLTNEHRPWTMAASLTLQAAIAGGIVLTSILSIQQLPMVSLPRPVPPYRTAPKAVELVPTPRSATSSTAYNSLRQIFREPSRIPTTITRFLDDLPTGPPSIPGSIDVPGGGGGGGGPVGAGFDLFNNAARVAPPPPPPAKPPAVAKETQPVRLGGNVLEARLIRRVVPEYPALARQARISGKVQLMGIIGRDGLVKELKLISGHPLLAPSALNAVRQWLYSPTLLNGEPVEVVAPIEVNFLLN